MRQTNIPGLDLSLLPALDALLRHRNVTLAAAEVGLSQPAMSRALARLRDLFGDPLLVRAGGRLILTARAVDLAPRVVAAMEAVRGVYQPAAFAPERLERTIRIASTDIHAVLLGPPLAALVAHEAPGVDLRFEMVTPDIVARMERGEVDFAFALASTPLPPGSASAPLAADRLAVVLRRGHPMAGSPFTVKDYARVDHVGVSIFGDRPSDLDAALALHGVTRRIALTTPHFLAALAVVARTDYATTVSQTYAARFAGLFDLVLTPPPVPAELPQVLVWSQARGADPALAWLRALIARAAVEAYGEPAP